MGNMARISNRDRLLCVCVLFRKRIKSSLKLENPITCLHIFILTINGALLQVNASTSGQDHTKRIPSIHPCTHTVVILLCLIFVNRSLSRLESWGKNTEIKIKKRQMKRCRRQRKRGKWNLSRKDWNNVRILMINHGTQCDTIRRLCMRRRWRDFVLVYPFARYVCVFSLVWCFTLHSHMPRSLLPFTTWSVAQLDIHPNPVAPHFAHHLTLLMALLLSRWAIRSWRWMGGASWVFLTTRPCTCSSLHVTSWWPWRTWDDCLTPALWWERPSGSPAPRSQTARPAAV